MGGGTEKNSLRWGTGVGVLKALFETVEMPALIWKLTRQQRRGTLSTHCCLRENPLEPNVAVSRVQREGTEDRKNAIPEEARREEEISKGVKPLPHIWLERSMTRGKQARMERTRKKGELSLGGGGSVGRSRTTTNDSRPIETATNPIETNWLKMQSTRAGKKGGFKGAHFPRETKKAEMSHEKARVQGGERCGKKMP